MLGWQLRLSTNAFNIQVLTGSVRYKTWHSTEYNTRLHTCSLVCAFVTNSRPTRIRGRRNALVSSTTGTPIRWHTFWATVSFGKAAWSEFLSWMNCKFPSWSTHDRVLCIAATWKIVQPLSSKRPHHINTAILPYVLRLPVESTHLNRSNNYKHESWNQQTRKVSGYFERIFCLPVLQRLTS